MRNEAISALTLADLKPGFTFSVGPKYSFCAYDPATGRLAIVNAERKEIVIFSSRGEKEMVLPAAEDGSLPLCFTPFAGDGRFLAVRHLPGDRLRVWDL